MPLCTKCKNLQPFDELDDPPPGTTLQYVAVRNDGEKNVHRPTQTMDGDNPDPDHDHWLYYLDDETISPKDFGFEHHRMSDMKDYAFNTAKCPCCVIILEAVDHFDAKREEQDTAASLHGPSRDSRVLVTRRIYSEDWSGYSKKKKYGRGWEDAFAMYIPSKHRGTMILLGEVGLVVDDDDPLGRVFKGRIAQQRVDQSTLDRAIKWIDNCQDHHDEFHPKASRLPTRVLDLNSSPIKLVETKNLAQSEKVDFYTTLSYRWDIPKREVKTTPTNYRSHIASGIPNLPQTFLDAIRVTKAMKIRWLWIDALCIIQQSAGNKDFLTEAPKMGSYYSNSYLTIVSSATRDSRKGLLKYDRTLPTFGNPFPYYINRALRGNAQAFLQRYDISTLRNTLTVMEKEPISSRGWTFQERVLSPRNLYFAKDQCYLECLTEMVGEYGFWQEGCSYSLGQPGIGIYALKKDKSIDRWEVQRYWNELMSLYTGRSLTNWNDKLAAVAGLAQKFKTKLPSDNYCARMWSGSILNTLLWESPKTSGNWDDRKLFLSSVTETWPENRDNGKQDDRNHKYLAPSWSWANMKVNVGISFHQSRDLKFVASYNGCFIETLDSAYGTGFGPINKNHPGYITLQIHLIRIYIDRREYKALSRNKKYVTQRWWRISTMPDTQTRRMLPVSELLAFDYVIERPKSISFKAAIVAYSKAHDRYIALILTRLAGSDAWTKKYVRVGCVMMQPDAVGKVPGIDDLDEITIY